MYKMENIIEQLISKRKILLIYFFLFGLTRISFLLNSNMDPNLLQKDAALYYNISSNLINNRKYAADLHLPNFGNPVKDNIYAKQTKLTAQVPPGYPAFLTVVRFLFNDHLFFIYLSQILLELMSHLIMFFVLKRFYSSKVGFYYLILSVLFLPIGIFSTKILTESIFITLITIYVSLIIYFINTQEKKWIYFNGILAGIASLIRPTPLPLFLFLPIIIWLFYHSNGFLKFRLLFPYYLSIGLILFPWGYRNYLIFEKPVVTSTLGGLSLFFVSSEREGGLTGNFLPKIRENSSLTSYFEVNNINVNKYSLSEVELDYYFREIGIKNIVNNPKNYLLNVIINFTRFWFNLPFRQHSFFTLIYALFILFALNYIVIRSKFLFKFNIVKILLIFPAFFSIVHSLIGNTSYRYALPILPIIFVLISFAYSKTS